MPYTPPSHRSPASSASASPDVSRRPSFQTGSRPSLPRSSSYMSKHRRTPSVTTVADGSAGSLTPQGTSEDLPALAAGLANHGSGSVRQSPIPWSDDGIMPKGAVISPPDSASSGSDDERAPELRGRKSEKLKDLRDAVSQIPHARTPSPSSRLPSTNNALLRPHGSAPHKGMHISLSTSALGDFQHPPPRKISHVRSATEPSAALSQENDDSLSNSEEDTDEDLKNKPQMVRKKSGELVRPALRPSSRRRPSSMPGTPVFSKAVHFDSHLEHVRHFLQVDRPLAVSAGSSPVDNYESDNEYPFPSESRPAARGPPYEWEIMTPNFPHDSLTRKTLPVKLERVWLSADQKTMLGSVAVANLAFQKHITCRFTFDYWKTTSEVTAEYSHEIRPRDTPVGYDRFNFSVKLSDTANLESKTLFFCVRYSVNGKEFWDNNASANFQVDFRKKHLPQNGKNNFQGAAGRSKNALPRSNRRQNPPSALRPKSMPVSLGEFGNDSQFKFGQPIHEYLGETESTGLRLKTKSSSNIASDNIAKGLSSPSGVVFANRYDFGASLSAAVQAAKDSMGRDKDALYMKDLVRSTGSGNGTVPDAGQRMTSPPVFSPTMGASGSDSPVPSLPSASYEELVNKYCFFGTKATVPSKAPQTKSGNFDGASGEEVAPKGHTAAFIPRRATIGDDGSAGLHPRLTPDISSPTESPPSHYLAVAGGTPGATPSSSVSASGPAPSGFEPMGSPNSSEDSYHGQESPLPDRFAWRGDTHTTPVIRG